MRLNGTLGGEEGDEEEEWGRKGWGSWWREGEESGWVSRWVEDSLVEVGEAGVSLESDWEEEIAGDGISLWMVWVVWIGPGWWDDEGGIENFESWEKLEGNRTKELPGEAVTLQKPSERVRFFEGNWVSSKLTFWDRYTLWVVGFRHLYPFWLEP
jgi:hypothetical protein